MSEAWFSGVNWAFWAPIIGAYVFGMATGWLIWGGRRSVPEEHGVAGETGDAAEKLDALQDEIRQAREILDESESEMEACADELGALDGAIKRANGRLKLILRVVLDR